jgi:hypothetical protein
MSLSSRYGFLLLIKVGLHTGPSYLLLAVAKDIKQSSSANTDNAGYHIFLFSWKR